MHKVNEEKFESLASSTQEDLERKEIPPTIMNHKSKLHVRWFSPAIYYSAWQCMQLRVGIISDCMQIKIHIMIVGLPQWVFSIGSLRESALRGVVVSSLQTNEWNEYVIKVCFASAVPVGPVVSVALSKWKVVGLNPDDRRLSVTPPAHVRRQSLPVWPPTLHNNYLYLNLTHE